jgi:hypothetical protein
VLSKQPVFAAAAVVHNASIFTTTHLLTAIKLQLCVSASL